MENLEFYYLVSIALDFLILMLMSYCPIKSLKILSTPFIVAHLYPLKFIFYLQSLQSTCLLKYKDDAYTFRYKRKDFFCKFLKFICLLRDLHLDTIRCSITHLLQIIN